MIIPKRKWRYPLSIEREYAKLLVQLVQKKFEVIETFLPEIVDKVYRNRLDEDDDEEESLTEKMLKAAGVAFLFDKIRRRIKKISALPIVNKIFGKVDKHTKTEQAETFKSVFGAEIQQKTPPKFEMLKTIWTAENMTLIKSIDNQTMEKIQYTLSQKIISAANKEILMQDLTQEIKNIAKVSESRAALIGADQVGKLNGRLVQYRQQSAGIEYFIWRTMGDRRVRPAHAAKNGVMYRWDSPVEKPGEAIRCRCVAQPVIDEQSFKLVPQKNSYTNANESGKMSAKEKPQWAERDKLKVLSKEEYKKLRELADSKGIYLSGVKDFDGKFETVKEVIETLADLQSKFPKVVDGKKKLTLEMVDYLKSEDFAETHGRVISLNANAYRDIKLLKSEYQKSVDDKFFVQGTDYRAIIHHEFGHVVADVYKIDPMEIACEVTGKGSIATLDFARKNLSKYAGKLKDGSEIIAEVFADMSTNSPSEFSRKFYDKVIQVTRGR